MRVFLFLLIFLFVGCNPVSNLPSVEEDNPADTGNSENVTTGGEFSVTAENEPSVSESTSASTLPEEDIVPRLMSSPSGDERIVGLLAGNPAPFSGILLNEAAAAWLEAEPDAVQERCQLFVSRRLGELRARLLSETERFELRISTMEQIHGIEIRARDSRIEELLRINEYLRNNSAKWWEETLWIGGALLVGLAGGILIGFTAN